jgi:hypothetical protein
MGRGKQSRARIACSNHSNYKPSSIAESHFLGSLFRIQDNLTRERWRSEFGMGLVLPALRVTLSHDPLDRIDDDLRLRLNFDIYRITHR